MTICSCVAIKVKGYRLKVRTSGLLKSEQQRFTVQSGVLAGINSRQRSAISIQPLPERTDFGSLQ